MKFQMRDAEDDSDRKLLADVKKYGWHIVMVGEDSQEPAFAYSIGLTYSYKHPELFLMGLPCKRAAEFINVIGERVKKGERFLPGSVYSDIADGASSAFIKFGKRYYKPYLGYACWFYQAHDFSVIQYVWPDKAEKFPWDAGYDNRFFQNQLVLSENPKICWPFADAKNAAVFTHPTILNNERSILHVTHDAEDGAWQFLDGSSTNELSNAKIVCLEHIVNSDPSILLLGDLPLGWKATRSMKGEPWYREINNDNA